MAGSGKTAVVSRLAAHVATSAQEAGPTYLVNLDPAVADVPYEAAIDIRDTVRDGERERASLEEGGVCKQAEGCTLLPTHPPPTLHHSRSTTKT